eukprot:UN26624
MEEYGGEYLLGVLYYLIGDRSYLFQSILIIITVSAQNESIRCYQQYIYTFVSYFIFLKYLNRNSDTLVHLNCALYMMCSYYITINWILFGSKSLRKAFVQVILGLGKLILVSLLVVVLVEQYRLSVIKHEIRN